MISLLRYIEYVTIDIIFLNFNVIISDLFTNS